MENVFNFLRTALPWIPCLLAAFFLVGTKNKKEQTDDYGTEGMCIGMCIGTAIDTGIGISLGMLIGLVIGTCIKKENRSEGNNEK